MKNGSQTIFIGSNSRLPSRWLPIPPGHPACAMATGVANVHANASFATVCTDQSYHQRRTVHPGKMIASTWTRLADAPAESRSQREPAPPRHSQSTSAVPSHLLLNGIFMVSTSSPKRGSAMDVRVTKTIFRVTSQSFLCQ